MNSRLFNVAVLVEGDSLAHEDQTLVLTCESCGREWECKGRFPNLDETVMNHVKRGCR